jgi:hypothetical protein
MVHFQDTYPACGAVMRPIWLRRLAFLAVAKLAVVFDRHGGCGNDGGVLGGGERCARGGEDGGRVGPVEEDVGSEAEEDEDGVAGGKEADVYFSPDCPGGDAVDEEEREVGYCVAECAFAKLRAGAALHWGPWLLLGRAGSVLGGLVFRFGEMEWRERSVRRLKQEERPCEPNGVGWWESV